MLGTQLIGVEESNAWQYMRCIQDPGKMDHVSFRLNILVIYGIKYLDIRNVSIVFFAKLNIILEDVEW